MTRIQRPPRSLDARNSPPVFGVSFGLDELQHYVAES